MAALYILRFGHCWRVGDGLSINVYWDRWIPKYPTNRPFLSVRDDEEEVWVSSLINQDLHVWRRDFIMFQFNREEREAICDIPLNRRQVSDFVYWKSWDKLTLSKKDGGMGFRDLRAFNLGMLAKQGWRLLKDTNSLLYQCFKARYFPRTSVLEATESPNCSFVWRSLVAALPILRMGHCW